jgi:hypothetical protein
VVPRRLGRPSGALATRHFIGADAPELGFPRITHELGRAGLPRLRLTKSTEPWAVPYNPRTARSALIRESTDQRDANSRGDQPGSGLRPVVQCAEQVANSITRPRCASSRSAANSARWQIQLSARGQRTVQSRDRYHHSPGQPVPLVRYLHLSGNDTRQTTIARPRWN